MVMEKEDIPQEIKEIANKVEELGGEVLSIYKEPFNNKWQLFVKLPIERVRPAPFQRDISTFHVERLISVIQKTGRFIDPIVLVGPYGEVFWTPNGTHRLEAMKMIGATHITGILIPDETVASYILALNTEKVPDLRDKSLEILRMYREFLKKTPEALEEDYAEYFEFAHYITFGFLYEKYEKFSGTSYETIIKKVDRFLQIPLKDAINERQRRAQRIDELHQKVNEVIMQLRERGVKHPFLRSMIVSQINPIKRKRIVEEDFDEVLDACLENLNNLDLSIFTPERLEGLGMF